MVKHDAPQIKSVNINKEGRFWSLTVNGNLLAIILYKRGAEATQVLLQRLAGLPVTVDPEETKEPTASKKAPSKPLPPGKPTKSKTSSPKPKPPVKRPAPASEPQPVSEQSEPAPAIQ